MAKAKKSGQKLYEGLFLLSQGAVASDFAGVVEHVRELFTRADAELIVLRKWNEQRLAYEIAGQKRGTFLLAYFRSDGPGITHIERDVKLSERIVRTLIINAEHLGEAELEAAKEGAELSLEVKLRESDASASRSSGGRPASAKEIAEAAGKQKEAEAAGDTDAESDTAAADKPEAVAAEGDN